MKRLIVYRLGSLGDTIVALPCLHKIRERFPDTERILLTNNPVSPAAPRMADILDGSGLIDGVITYDIETRSFKRLLALALRLRRLSCQALVYLPTPRGPRALRRDLAFFRLCGIKQVIAAPTSPDLMQNRIDDHGEEEYECARLARCLAALGPIDLDDPRSWQLGLSPQEMQKAEIDLTPIGARSFVGINMGTKSTVNDWGHENWKVLLGRLALRFPTLCWVFVGAHGDAGRGQDITSRFPDRMLNLCGMTSIRGTAAVLSKAQFFLGHDSGPLHLAAACAVPSVGLFSTQNRRHKWFPYGRQHVVLYPAGPITTITVEEVFEAACIMHRARSRLEPLVGATLS